MIQVYADGVLAYDSRLEEYTLQTLKATTGLNKGGLAEIQMPAGHPAYEAFTAYKSIAEIYRDGRMLFRGRALLPADDFYNNRTVTCEGELCFLRDAVVRPYRFSASPATVLTELMGIYNAQVEPVKRFKVGTITVTDPNDYIVLESESAESVQAAVNKLLERCGGYIVFTTDPDDGARVINWYAETNYRSGQLIEFGENLLDFSRDGGDTNLATAVLPYGAKDAETGQRITIESVNGGVDYIQDDAAVALRGFIITPVFWDDVTLPANLLKKAQAWLEQNKNVITSLRLSAFDLSYMDKDIDSYQVGDKIRVKSKPHRLDEDFLLTERTEDLLNPNNNNITLGKDRSTLTGADVAGDTKSQSDIQRVTTQIKNDYEVNVAAVVQATEQTLISLIEQTSESIRLEVAEGYATNDQLTESISTVMTQLADQILLEFNSLKTVVDENDADARTQFEELYNYIHLADGVATFGSGDSAITLSVENDMIVFKNNGQTKGWWDGEEFHTGDIVIEVNQRAQFGNFALVPRSNGSISWLKVRG